MTAPILKLGQPVDLAHLGDTPGDRREMVLVKTSNVEVMYLAIPAGGNIPTYSPYGEVLLHCLDGRVYLSANRLSGALRKGQLVRLEMNEPFSIHAVEHARLLVTIVAPKVGPNVELIG